MKKINFRVINFSMLVGVVLFLGVGVCDVLTSDPVAFLRVISLIGITIVCAAIFTYTIKVATITDKGSWVYPAYLLGFMPLVLPFTVLLAFVYWIDINAYIEGYVPGVLGNFGWNIFSIVSSWLFWALFSIVEIIDLILLFFGKKPIPAEPVK